MPKTAFDDAVMLFGAALIDNRDACEKYAWHGEGLLRVAIAETADRDIVIYESEADGPDEEPFTRIAFGFTEPRILSDGSEGVWFEFVFGGIDVFV